MEKNNYLIFVLGYNLLQSRLIKSGNTECDIVYDICINTYDCFLESKYSERGSFSDYENLRCFINETEFDWENIENK